MRGAACSGWAAEAGYVCGGGNEGVTRSVWKLAKRAGHCTTRAVQAAPVEGKKVKWGTNGTQRHNAYILTCDKGCEICGDLRDDTGRRWGRLVAAQRQQQASDIAAEQPSGTPAKGFHTSHADSVAKLRHIPKQNVQTASPDSNTYTQSSPPNTNNQLAKTFLNRTANQPPSRTTGRQPAHLSVIRSIGSTSPWKVGSTPASSAVISPLTCFMSARMPGTTWRAWMRSKCGNTESCGRRAVSGCDQSVGKRRPAAGGQHALGGAGEQQWQLTQQTGRGGLEAGMGGWPPC
eukprot:362265-Chlamydomonas_euryale.AAC.14